MTRRLALLATLLVALVALPAAEASARVLSIAKAKALAVKEAEKVKSALHREGATTAEVPGCWRVHAHKVGCYFSLNGYDRELQAPWHCMLRVSVRLNDRAGARYRVTLGHPVCH